MSEPEQKPHIRAVLIDWDFTLSEHNGRTIQNWGEAARHILRGAKVEESHVACVTDPKKDAKRNKGANQFYKIFNAHLMEGGKETIEWLLQHDIPVFIVSNAPQGALSDQVKKQLGEELATKVPCYGSTSCPDTRKPHPEAFMRPLKEHNIPVGRNVFMIGDRARYDFEPAYEMGLTPILFNPAKSDEKRAWEYTKKNQILEFFIVKNHDELRTKLGEFLNRGNFSLQADQQQQRA